MFAKTNIDRTVCQKALHDQTEKKTPIRLIAVRETGVFRHHGGLIKSSSETPRYDRAVMMKGVSGVPSIGPLDAERHLSL